MSFDVFYIKIGFDERSVSFRPLAFVYSLTDSQEDGPLYQFTVLPVHMALGLVIIPVLLTNNAPLAETS